MYHAQVENKNGEVLVMTGNEAVYQIINIEGLNPPNAQINTTAIVGMDGAVYNSSKLETRNIVLTVKINGDVETNRQNLYNYFRTKEWCRFYYSNNNRSVYIDAYVDTVQCNIFSRSEQAQISIICPYPYFKSLNEIMTDISSTLGLFTFPFTINRGSPIPFSLYNSNRITNIYNESESEVGMTIDINFSGSVSKLQISNVETGEMLTLNYSFLANDNVIINTQKGKKSITLIRDGEKTNLFSALQKGSKFFQLEHGYNSFGYLADNGSSNDNVTILFYHSVVYRGV